MPIRLKYTIRNGRRVGYYQWGSRKKYFFKPGNKRSRQGAKKKAQKQAKAIYARGWRE